MVRWFLDERLWEDFLLQAAIDSAVEQRGKNEGHAVGNQLGGDNTVQSHKMIQNQKDGDGKQTLSANAENEGFLAFAHGLQAVDLLEIGYHKGSRQAGDPQKAGSVRNGRPIPDEDPDDLRRYL